MTHEEILAARQDYEQRGGGLADMHLERKIFRKLLKLERAVDEVGPADLRHALSELIVQMRGQLWAFDQEAWEKDL